VTPPGGARAASGVRAAVIDVGSNSVLLLAVEVGPGGARVLDSALATTRLGAGLRRGGALDPAAVARTSDAVAALAARARGAGIDALWAFATAAARDASDGEAFARCLAARAGIDVEVLSGAEEARLAYEAVGSRVADDGPVLAVDVGGRSTELTLGVAGAIGVSTSVPLGALALTEDVLRTDPPAEAEVRAAEALIAGLLADSAVIAGARAGGARVVASGGTVTSLAALDLGLATYDGRRVHGHVLADERVAGLAHRLVAMPSAARAGLGGIDPGRAAILPAGALVFAGIVHAASTGSVLVSDHGVRHAYLRARLAARGVPLDLEQLAR
jgi:exopolyphosphatase/guanosine-5'-triphosphate,3'-diphosphate pyrophosphatase